MGKGPKRRAKPTDERHRQNKTKPARLRPKQKRNRAARICPVHGVRLVHVHAESGMLWKCPEPKCTIRCGAGATSTPADSRTFAERTRTHELFDPLWRRGPGKRFARREGAYEWLGGVMGLAEKDTHIGCFDLEKCLQAQAAIRELLKA
jgi:hypothetical protein